jgi:hypothetical protein
VTGRAQGLAYWLIARNDRGQIEVLTLDGKKTLAVFSSEDEAEMFLRLESVADGWQVSESRGGGLVSMLYVYGLCAGVKDVALDPLPEMVGRQDRRARELGSGTLHTAPLGQKGILRAGSRIVATRGRAEE